MLEVMNIIGWWKLNDCNDSDDVPDTSGNGFDFTGGTATFGSGVIGNAAYFNGDGSQYLYRDPLPGLSLYLPWSIAFWLKINPTTTEVGTILNQCDAANNRVAIQHNNVANEVRVLLYDNYLSGGVVGAASGVFGLDVWRHVALTWNGSDELKLYFDGTLQTGTHNAGSSSTSVLVIGSRYGGTSPLDGAMDDLRIYNAASPVEKIKAIVADREGRPYPWQPHIVEPTLEEIVQHG